MRLLIFFQIYFFKKVSVSNNLDSEQAQHSISPDLGPNHLQRLSSAEDKLQPAATQKEVQKLVFKTDYSLMQFKSIAECSKGSILQFF